MFASQRLDFLLRFCGALCEGGIKRSALIFELPLSQFLFHLRRSGHCFYLRSLRSRAAHRLRRIVLDIICKQASVLSVMMTETQCADQSQGGKRPTSKPCLIRRRSCFARCLQLQNHMCG